MVEPASRRSIDRQPTYYVRRALMAACLLALGGCGGVTASPEQEAAMKRIQYLGGRVSFNSGGYKVDMIGTQVDDSDLEQFKNIKNLKHVNLRGTNITDAGLKQLESIESLEYVIVSRTAATREGVKSLKRALPKADVNF